MSSGITSSQFSSLQYFNLLSISVELQGFEPWTPALQRQCSSQLSYSPKTLVGLGGLEPPTSRLSGVRSNHLSYKPLFGHSHRQFDRLTASSCPLLYKEAINRLFDTSCVKSSITKVIRSP